MGVAPPVESLDVWKLSHELALEICRVTQRFPAEERFGLTAQLRRAATSIPASLAEGNARESPREYLHFCLIARGSLAEVRYFLRLSRDMGLINEDTFTSFVQGYDRVGKMLHFLIVSLRKRAVHLAAASRSRVPPFPRSR